MKYLHKNTLLVCLLSFGLYSCGDDRQESTTLILPTDSDAAATPVNADNESAQSESVSNSDDTSQWSQAPEINAAMESIQTEKGLQAALDPTDIPYPLYPNGSSYRIGGQGNLKIILFQTEDTFEQVDAYYQEQAGLPRLSAMSDYVRYSAANDDIDPWATSKPGIVIHQFNDASEREAVGAGDSANTNIIMSFE